MKYFLSFVVLCCFMVDIPKSYAKKAKDKTGETECPTTCKLRRRIGKMENTFSSQLQDLNIELAQLNETNQVRLVNSIERVYQKLVDQMYRYVNQSVVELKLSSADNQIAIERASTDIGTLIQGIPNVITQKFQHHLKSNGMSNEGLVRSLNSTITNLKRQNRHLSRRVKIDEDLQKIIRDQNDILSTQNRELRENNQRISRKTDSILERVTALEGVVALHNTTLQGGGTATGVSPSQLQSINAKIQDAKSTAVNAQSRIGRIEEWLSEAGNDGVRLPLLVPTSHPQPDTPPNDCQELFEMGYKETGAYMIKPWQSREAFQVYCEQSYYGGGWTVIQRRRDGSETFERDWNDYALGFGNVDAEFWLGNEKIHQITNQNTYRLHIVLLDWENNRAYAEYDGFKVASSRDYYSARFGAYHGTAGDAMRGTAEDGSRNLYLTRFGARDLDNDFCDPCMYEGRAFTNCAELQNGGWWYKACADANLNGRYISQEDFESCNYEDCYGINWRTWHDEVNYSLKASLMMLKTITPDQENDYEYDDS